MRFIRRLASQQSIAGTIAITGRRSIGTTTSSSMLLAPFRPRGSTASSRSGDDYNDDVSNVDGGISAAFPGRAGSGGPAPTGANGSFTGGPGASLAPKPHLQETPTKDRMPPAAYNPRDPRRRLAVLIDGSRVDASTYATAIEPAIYSFGVPVMVRVFDTDLRDGWLDLVEPSLAHGAGGAGGRVNNSLSDSPHDVAARAASSSGMVRAAEGPESERRAPYMLGNNSNAGSRRAPVGSKGASSSLSAVLPPIEWFRVDRFIPINIQIAADTQHIFDFRSNNRIEGVVVVCTEGERAIRFEKYFSRLQGKGFSQFSFDEKGVATSFVEDGRDGDGSQGL